MINLLRGYVILLLLVGCTPSFEVHPNNIELSAGGAYGAVQEIHLKDGTLCVVFLGFNKGGITCNWGNK